MPVRRKVELIQKERQIGPYWLPYHWCLHGFYKHYYERKYALCRPYLKTMNIVLDIGGGDGRLAFLLSWHVKRVYCVDKEHRALVLGNMIVKDTGASVTFVTMDGQDIGFADNTFDLATMFDVIEHIPLSAVSLVLREVYRVLIPGGLLLLTTPNRRNLRSMLWGHRLNPKHHWEYTIHEAINALVAVGFQIRKVSGLYIPPPIPHIELLSNQYPFRPVFELLVQLGAWLPALSETMFLVAEKPGCEGKHCESP